MGVCNLIRSQWLGPDTHLRHVAVEGIRAIQAIADDNGIGHILQHPGVHLWIFCYIARSGIESDGIIIKIVNHHHTGEIRCGER